MTKAALNLPRLKRVANVSIVAMCMVSSLVLLGAMPAELASGRKGVTKAVDVRTFTEQAKPVAVEAEAEAVQAAYKQSAELLDTAATPAAAKTPAAAVKSFVMRMEVTAYCPCVKCCGPLAQGITASGKLVDYNGGKFVAADTKVLPFGRKLVVPGYAGNAPVEVIDRGGAIKGNKLDLYFPTHAEARLWGRQQVNVTVFE